MIFMLSHIRSNIGLWSSRILCEYAQSWDLIPWMTKTNTWSSKYLCIRWFQGNDSHLTFWQTRWFECSIPHLLSQLESCWAINWVELKWQPHSTRESNVEKLLVISTPNLSLHVKKSESQRKVLHKSGSKVFMVFRERWETFDKL